MSYVFVSPAKYIQGPDVLSDIAAYAMRLGSKPCLLISKGGISRFGKTIEESFLKEGMDYLIEGFQGVNGECTEDEIDRVAKSIEDNHCDLMIGIGGGKVMDTAKLAACGSRLPVIIVPTIAATDAPTAGRAVIYTPEGVSKRTVQLPSGPDLVLVDSRIIARAPIRYLVSGMGDALATYFETRTCIKTGSDNPAGGQTTAAAYALSAACYDMLKRYGRQAKADAMEGKVSYALERIIEANTLLSGLGFESGGLAAAHAVNKGLTHVKECDAFYHGERVAFGTLCQLYIEGDEPDLLEEVLTFCHDVGLPVTLEEIGLNADETDKIMCAAEYAADPAGHCKNETVPVSAGLLCEAMLAVDRMGRKLKN